MNFLLELLRVASVRIISFEVNTGLGLVVAADGREEAMVVVNAGLGLVAAADGRKEAVVNTGLGLVVAADGREEAVVARLRTEGHGRPVLRSRRAAEGRLLRLLPQRRGFGCSGAHGRLSCAFG